MPLYEYEPTLVSADEPYNECCFFETLQSLSETPLTVCPTCGHTIHRAVSSFSMPAPREGLFRRSTLDAMKADKASRDAAASSASQGTAARRAARMAMRHVCGLGCRH